MLDRRAPWLATSVLGTEYELTQSWKIVDERKGERGGGRKGRNTWIYVE
jgi:hypothetical protein